MSDIKEKIEELKKAASVVYPDSSILHDLCICQAILESGVLQGGSALANIYNNYFGIKGVGIVSKKWINLPTKEFLKGKWITIAPRDQTYTSGVSFAWNNTISESFMQHRRILSLNRYKPVWAKKSVSEACIAVKTCGYATDPGYPLKLIDIYNTYIKNK